jgi:hypothetical protein
VGGVPRARERKSRPPVGQPPPRQSGEVQEEYAQLHRLPDVILNFIVGFYSGRIYHQIAIILPSFLLYNQKWESSERWLEDLLGLFVAVPLSSGV